MGLEVLSGRCRCVGRVGVSWGVGGWCVGCIGKVVENGVVMVCERTNG